jgi:hypothetical protein
MNEFSIVKVNRLYGYYNTFLDSMNLCFLQNETSNGAVGGAQVLRFGAALNLAFILLCDSLLSEV